MNRKELRHDRHIVSLLTDHLVFSRIKGSTSRILRKEFPHLREWCGEHFWAPRCFHGSVGNGWDVVKSIFVSKISMNIIERNKENDSYRPRNICTGYTVVTALCAPFSCIWVSNLNRYNCLDSET